MIRRTILAVTLLAIACNAAIAQTNVDASLPAEFHWKLGPVLAAPRDLPGIHIYSIKDPSVVRYEDRWHLFCTIRGKERSHGVVYLSFADWSEAKDATWQLLPTQIAYLAAPQVFYFAPQRRWYLICQAASDDWNPKYQPAFATTENIADPASWSKLQPLGATKPEAAKAWLDFWVICDESKAHLFFTSLDGKMWRSEANLADFPHGWGEATIALEGDIFEASHTYRIKGRDRYFTFIEAQNGHGWRYFKAYAADRLEGPWKPLADTKERSFASMKNVEHPAERWTDSISHGELLRSGYDQRLEVDPQNLRLVIQGVLESERQGKPYGEIPWSLGLLEQTTEAPR